MTRAVTENFHEMVVEVMTAGDPPPVPITVLSLSNANPAVVSVGTGNIGLFTNGDTVLIAGAAGTGMTAANGSHPISAVNTGAGTFALTGIDTSTGAGPQTSGVTVTPAAGDPAVWSKICGLTQRGIERTHNMQTTEVPDCDDESLPAAVERAVQSSEVTSSGTGVWAAQSHEMMMDWWYSAATKYIRVGHIKAATGDTKYEQGPAYLTQLNNAAERGTKVTADISIEFDGLPQRIAA